MKNFFNYKRIILTAAVMLFMSIVAFGSGAAVIYSELMLDDGISVEEVKSQDRMNFSTNAYGFEKIKSMVDKSAPINYDEYQKILSYSVFLAENEFTKEQLEYINSLLDAGYSEGVIQEVYEFWLTTDEDFSMIGDLCALSNEMYGIYWVENAFNKLTNNSHGVLEREDIEVYYEQGLTYEDIYAANILSRRKGQTIQGILDDMLSGKTNSEIITDVGMMPKSRSISGKIDNVERSVALRIINNYQLEMSDIPEDESEIAEYIDNLENERYRNNVEMVKEELSNAGIIPEEIDREARRKENNESRNAAVNNGFDTYLISSFLKRGYTYEQIEKASEICLVKDVNPLEAIKSVEKGAE